MCGFESCQRRMLDNDDVIAGFRELFLERKAALEERHPWFEFDSLGGWAPMQGEGTYRGNQHFYFRFRMDTASLQIWPAGVDDMDPANHPELVAYMYSVTGEKYAGALDTAPLIYVFGELVDRLAPHDSETNPSGVERMQATLDAVHKAMEKRDEQIEDDSDPEMTADTMRAAALWMEEDEQTDVG